MILAPYIMLLGNTPRPWSERIERWLEALVADGLQTLPIRGAAMAMVHPATPYLTLPDQSGFVIGHVFNRTTNARATNFQGAGELSINRFVERYWGGYVACRFTDGRQDIWRDPSGEVPCYYAKIDGIRIATSRPSWLYDASLLSPALNWAVLKQALIFRDFRPQLTALRGLAELLPGTSLAIENSRAWIQTIWSPWQFTEERSEIRDPATAAEMLRETTTACLGAWAGCFDRPLLEISGGLDSAIVAAGFRIASRGAMCLTFGPTVGDPDELPYAKAIAARLDLPLRIETLSVSDVNILTSDGRHLPRPCARNFSQALDRILARAARETDADAFFSGGGGDSVFGHLQSALPAIDRYRREGLGRGLLSTIDDVAVLGRVTIWKALETVARRALRPAPPAPSFAPNRFVRALAATTLTLPDHPWLTPDPATLPAKRWHVWAMIGIYNYMEGFDRLKERPIISPLMAQPLFELCLRIPMWLWCDGGINRAVARQAFADILPPEVIARPTKGAFDGFGAALIDQNRIVLRDLLLDGALAREDLVDVAKVEQSLAGPIPDGKAIVDLLTLADTEVWIRSWEARV